MGSYGIVQPPYPMMGLALYGTKGSAVADFTDFEPSSLKVRLMEDEQTDDTSGGEARTQLQGARQEYHYPVDMAGAYGQGTAVKRYMTELEEAIVNDHQPSLCARENAKTILALDASWQSAKSGKAAKVKSSL